MDSVLLVDDDIELVEMLRDYLSRDGFAVQVAHDGESGALAAVAGSADIVVLDVMMPGQSGLDTLAAIRRRSAIPVIMLTARGEDADRIIGFELGADDYVPKPCTPRELAARIRAILKRTYRSKLAESADAEPVVAGRLMLKPDRRSASWNGEDLKLTSTEFDLLEVLARKVGRPVSKQELSLKALGRPLERFDRSIDVHVSSIRAKIGQLDGNRSAIRTITRKGYQLLADPH